jgi:hypothetical protein
MGNTLEIAVFCILITGKCYLWLLLLQQVQDFPVRDIAYLIIFLDNLALFVANTALFIRHHSIACFIGLANIAVDAFPTFIAIAVFIGSWKSGLAIGQRSAY